MSSLFKISSKIENILGVLTKKPHKGHFQMSLYQSAGTKTFENLKLKNYRFDISETCPLCVPN